MCRAFSPLAEFEVDPNDPQRVVLKPRASELPRGPDAPPWATAGDVFLPILRRTARNGKVEKNGIQVVPWTYLQAVEGKDKLLTFEVTSGSRRAFSGRRQGRVEQLAIAVRPAAEATTLSLHARKPNTKPLVGYEVLSATENPDSPKSIGFSDRAGEVRIQPGKQPIDMLLIKHGGQLMAKIPVVPGAEQLVNVSLPDDDARLAAEARLAALREDLIDVVARRNILIARTRQKIKKKDYAGAQELLRNLDELPGQPQFDFTLDSSERLLHTDDPLMQRKITQMFAATRKVMSHFLTIKPINDMHDELREAQQKSPAKANKT